MSRTVSAILIFAGLLGCHSAPAPSRPSLGSELKQQDEQLVGQRFRTLLDFETDADLVFAKADGASHRSTPGHTGQSALFAERGVTFKIDSLLYGAALPGEWTLLGTYVRPTADEMITAELIADDKVIATFSRAAAKESWAFVSIDLTSPDLIAPLRSPRHVTLHLIGRDAEYDDVALVNNTRTRVSTADWQITQRGAALHVAEPGAPDLAIPLAGAAVGGWALDDICPLRLCLHQGEHYLTLLPGHQSIRDGVLSVGEVNAISDQSSVFAVKSPGEAVIEVDESCGRLDRDTAGDTNNNGYNERLGAYEIKSTRPRMSIKILPGDLPVQSPLLEIAGLPLGKVSAMIEGKLVDTVCRLPDGRVLVLLPILIDRPTELKVRASDN